MDPTFRIFGGIVFPFFKDLFSTKDLGHFWLGYNYKDAGTPSTECSLIKFCKALKLLSMGRFREEPLMIKGGARAKTVKKNSTATRPG